MTFGSAVRGAGVVRLTAGPAREWGTLAQMGARELVVAYLDPGSGSQTGQIIIGLIFLAVVLAVDWLIAEWANRKGH